MFVAHEPVPIFLPGDPANRIYIKPRMDYGTKSAVMDTLAKMNVANGVPETQLMFGAYSVALLVRNIVRWEGPQFEGVPCTPAIIVTLDPSEPLVELVVEEITRRNPLQRDSPNPKSAGANGSMKRGVPVSQESEDSPSVTTKPT